MGSRGFWVALAIVLFYLIARPRIGTIWYVNVDAAEPVMPSNAATPANPFMEGYTPPPQANPLLNDTPAPSLRPGPPRAAFMDRRDCVDAAAQYEREGAMMGVYCASKNALLWGW
jgi:hypothetical protein